MAFDLYSGGSLFYHIHRRTAPEIANTGRLAAGLHGLSDETVRFYGAEVVAGLGYLHQVMHARMVVAVVYAPMPTCPHPRTRLQCHPCDTSTRSWILTSLRTIPHATASTVLFTAT